MSNFNSMEAFAEWFDENIKSLEECESEGVDIECEMKKWCENNNHDYNDYDDSRRIGVYNNNTDDTWTCEYCGDKLDNCINYCGCKGETEAEKENHTCHLCGYECADMVYPDKEETPFCDKCWIKEQLDINSIYYAGDYNEDDEFLETKCGCEIIVNSREHDECRCDDDGENWICSECYNGEYDEKENALGCCSECAEELVEGYWWSRPERGLRFCADCGESVLKEEEEL